MTGIVGCMGGWCAAAAREKCAHYWSERPIALTERLCERGQDEPEVIRVIERRGHDAQVFVPATEGA